MQQSTQPSPASETKAETSTVPNVAQAAEPAIVTDAESALRCFEGDPLDRQQAERLLWMWSRRDELSDDDFAVVLDRFSLSVAENPSAADGLDDTADVRDALQRLEDRLRN